MTTPNGPVNVAGEGSRIGVQALHADIDTVILPGSVQLTVGQDASPAARYQAGVENLKSGNPEAARELIWGAMMSDQANYRMNSRVLFHWLVAMLSGRTVRQFSPQETGQLKRLRPRHAEAGGGEWADGVRLIYRLLDSVLPQPAARQRASETDMAVLVKEFESLGAGQRDMIRPHLELFLTGPLQDEMWQRELKRAQARQHSGGRRGRAWMFFQPIPAQVLLPPPWPERTSRPARLAMRAGTCLAAAAVAYLGWELLWHGALLGLLGYVAALAGGTVAAAADLEWRFLTGRRLLKDGQFRAPDPSAPRDAGDDLADGVDKLFRRYFSRYSQDKAERERWETAAAGLRRYYRNEIIAICRSGQVPANQVAWLIRYEVRELKQRWQSRTLHEYRQMLIPRPGMLAARRTGLAALVLGGAWAIVALRAYPLADAVALASAFTAWRCWLPASLERRRYAADSTEHAQRQAAIDKEYRRWGERLQARPGDEDMAGWLESDRTVLLGQALDHFRLPRSRLKAHAFLEAPSVAARRSQVEGAPWRFASYRLTAFLLAEDGTRQVRATLDFTQGTLRTRERTSYRYDSIVSARVLREAHHETFEIRLASGDPITIRVRDASPGEAQQDQDTEPAEEAQPATEAEEAILLGVSSLTDLLHMLERVAGEGPNWLQEHHWAQAWQDDDETGHEEEDT